MNSRVVQGTFDDENPDTRKRWSLPDGTSFDAERNTRAFIAAMPEWRRHGLLGFTLNLQGGSPEGYSRSQPWINSAFDFATGLLKPPYMARLALILDAADRLGMIPILGLFYFGQALRMDSEAAVIAATDAVTDWLIAGGYTNVLIEIANECDIPGYPPIVQPARAHELITRVQQRSWGRIPNAAGRLLVSTSYQGFSIPGERVAAAADFLLLHGNGVSTPAEITRMTERTRALPTYRGQPLLFSEDDHYEFNQPLNHFIAAIDGGAGWGFFDWRRPGESFTDGFQSMPVDWGIGSERKQAFFRLLAEITGEK